MARSTIAIKEGFDYQALFFWIQAIKLLIADENINQVLFESEEVKVVDDIVVEYKEAVVDELSTEPVEIDFFQLKYHVRQSNSFSSDNLLDPEFIGTKGHLLSRLYGAYNKFKAENRRFRLYIISSWAWDTNDCLCDHISSHGGFVQKFYISTNKSIVAFREKVKDTLKIDDDTLLDFLSTLRFKYLTFEHIKDQLNLLLRLSKLKPIDYTKNSNEYEVLPWKFYQQGRTLYSQESLFQLLERENLFLKDEDENEIFFISSYPTVAQKYIEKSSFNLDLSKYCDNPTCIDWENIKKDINSFVEKIYSSDKDILLLLQTKLSISIYLGYILKDQQMGIKLIPTGSNLTKWEEPDCYSSDNWHCIPTNQKTTFDDIIVTCSITNDVSPSVFNYIEQNDKLNDCPIFIFKNVSGINSRSILEPSQAWSMANELVEKISEKCNSNNTKLHLFYSGPSPLGFILGKKLQLKVSELFLYEFDKSSGQYISSINVKRS